MQYKSISHKNINQNFLKEYLYSRGVFDTENFLHPTEKNLEDPFKLNNIEKAANVLLNHISKDNNILIVVDCDEDGFTSSAMLWNYLKLCFPHLKLQFKIHEGKAHGLEDLIEEILQEGWADLVIEPDAGSNDEEFHKELCEAGIECIVLDHHMADKESDYAIVVNNQLSENYPNKDLCGGGVVFKFLQVLDFILKTDKSKNFIDLAAVALIGDMMNINNLENRYIIFTGLKNIKNVGLKALVDKQSFSIKDKDNLTPNDISFYITPLVNAVIRVGRKTEKETLFKAFIDGEKMVPKISRNKVVEGQFESIAEQNARNCVNARSRQNRALEKAIDEIDFTILKNGLNDNKIIVAEIDDDNIDSTLTGLLAMKIMAKYKKPVLLGRFDDYNIFKGSARGDGKGNLKDLRQFLLDSNYFEYAEGHPLAFGHAIKEENIENFINYANNKLKDVDLSEGVYEIDFVVDKSNREILSKLILELNQDITIFGKGCEEPLIAVEDLEINQDNISICGSNQDTIRIQKDEVTYIKFKSKDLIEELNNMNNITMTIIGTPNLNNWMGNISPQIIIKDYNLRDSIFDF